MKKRLSQIATGLVVAIAALVAIQKLLTCEIGAAEIAAREPWSGDLHRRAGLPKREVYAAVHLA